MQVESAVYFYKTRYELSIYRFYESGEVLRIVYDEGDFKDVESLAKGVTLSSFKKHKLPITKYSVNNNVIEFRVGEQKEMITFTGVLLDEDRSIKLTWTSKGNRKENIYTKMKPEINLLDRLCNRV